MSRSFHKFPRTPHLLWLGDEVPRDDKVMSRSDALEFLSGPVVVEEKIDGANLGLSLGTDGRIRAQSRGNYLAPGSSHSQWNPLWPWLAKRQDSLAAELGEQLILFGEWCYAIHTVRYNALPDWFLAFDVLDLSTNEYWSCDRRDALVLSLGLKSAPEVFRGRLTLDRISGLIGKSLLGTVPMEGVYLRREADGCLLARAKVVATQFRQQIEEHWTRRPLRCNQRIGELIPMGK